MLSDCWLCGMPLWRHLKAFKSNEWAQCGLTWGWGWGCSEEEMPSWAWGVCDRGVDWGGVSGDCHVEARRTPKLIYYFNSRSKCLPFVCSCFTISAECRSYKWCVIASHSELQLLYHIMRKHGVVNRFSNAAAIGILESTWQGGHRRRKPKGNGGIWFLSGFCVASSSNPVSMLLLN